MPRPMPRPGAGHERDAPFEGERAGGNGKRSHAGRLGDRALHAFARSVCLQTQAHRHRLSPTRTGAYRPSGRMGRRWPDPRHAHPPGSLFAALPPKATCDDGAGRARRHGFHGVARAPDPRRSGDDDPRSARGCGAREDRPARHAARPVGAPPGLELRHRRAAGQPRRRLHEQRAGHDARVRRAAAYDHPGLLEPPAGSA